MPIWLSQVPCRDILEVCVQVAERYPQPEVLEILNKNGRRTDRDGRYRQPTKVSLQTRVVSCLETCIDPPSCGALGPVDRGLETPIPDTSKETKTNSANPPADVSNTSQVNPAVLASDLEAGNAPGNIKAIASITPDTSKAITSAS